jgi:hypothetical protein
VSKFKQLVISNREELVTAMNGRSIPKIVLPKTGQIDVVERCMWILMQRFNCRRGLFLNPEHFKTTQMLVTNLSKISFPVIVFFPLQYKPPFGQTATFLFKNVQMQTMCSR